MKKIYGFVLVVLLLFVLTACGGSGGGKTINLMDYVSVAITGDDGYGKAAYDFDYGAFEDALAVALDADINSTQFFADATIIEEGISLSLGKTSDLSNGDTVVLTVSYNDKAAENYKVTFTGGTTTYTAEGLTEVAEFSAGDSDIIALLSETTVLYYAQNISISAENIQSFDIVDTQVDYQRNTAQVDYTYELNCKIAVLSVSGTINFKYADNVWGSSQLTHLADIKEYTLTGTYSGTEWDITASGASCDAVYVITDNGDGTYNAAVTWDGTITADITLLDSFDTGRFVITDNSAQTAAIGSAPYLYRALKFDFINGGFTTSGEVELLKTAD